MIFPIFGRFMNEAMLSLCPGLEVRPVGEEQGDHLGVASLAGEVEGGVLGLTRRGELSGTLRGHYGCQSSPELGALLSTPFHMVGSVWFQVAQKAWGFNFGGGWCGDVARDGEKKPCWR